MMPTFNVDTTKILMFKVEDGYFFRYYFDNEAMFDALRDYYGADNCHFEIPADGLNAVQQRLKDCFYELRVVEDLRTYCVAIQKNSDYSDIIRSAVRTKEQSDYLMVLLKDELSVEQAIEQGATRLEKSDLNGFI
jgi:hypothetical protein